MSIRDYGLQHWATVCSTWIWMAWNNCGRSPSTPMGRRVPSTLQGNCMVSRMCLVALLLLAKKVAFILEQPSSSLMFKHARLLAEPFCRFYLYPSWMAAFGGSSPKRTLFLVDQPYIGSKLSRQITRSEFVSSDDKTCTIVPADAVNVKKRVYSTTKLKQSQRYPQAYGKTVSSAYRSWRSIQPECQSDSSDSDYEMSVPDKWPDAQLRHLAGKLQARLAVSPSGHL